MSKNSVDSPPSAKLGSVNVNGENRVNTYDSNGQIVTDYNETDTEKQLRELRESMMASYLNEINSTSPSYETQINQQLEALKNQGTEYINDVYTPMITDLREDTAKRFGSLNNSSFLDGLNTLEDKRSDAVSDLSESLISKKNELEAEKLDQNLSTINLLSGLDNNYYDNMSSLFNQANTTSSMINDYLGSTYGTYVNAQNAADKNSNSLYTSYANTAQKTLAMLLPYIMDSDKNVKKDIKPLKFEEELLDTLKPYKFQYDREKNPKLPDGVHVGFMAQDVEKVIPEAVINTPTGKKVDYAAIIPVLLQQLQVLQDRVDKLSTSK